MNHRNPNALFRQMQENALRRPLTNLSTEPHTNQMFMFASGVAVKLTANH